MTDSAAPINDSRRLNALQQVGLLDTGPEEAFDRLTRLASKVVGVPIVLVSLVDKDRQFFKSMVGLPDEFAIPRQTPLSHSFCKHVVITGETLIVNDAREHVLLKDNPIIPHGVIAYAGFPLATADGLVLGSFCAIDNKPREWSQEQIDILRDLAAAAMTEIELRRANEELRQAGRAKDQFFAMLSHDLRTPLSPALLTATEMSADSTLPERFREGIQLIHRNIDLEVRMIDSLFDLTRIVSGKLSLHLEEADLNAVLRASLSMCGSDAVSKSIVLELDLRADRTTLRADAAKLQQAVCNLLKNAIKFSNPNSTVVLRSLDDIAESVRIEVTDQGIGIAAEALPHIFDAFQQGDRVVTQQFGGLGLGLAICKGIVEAHGGSIVASSGGKGRGTTMALTLPSATVPRREQAPPAICRQNASRVLEILLVEDHADSLRAMSRLLRKLEHHVTTATCVSGALDAAGSQDFDLLISDVGLPDGTGLQLMKELMSRRPLKGIALTGYGMESDIEQTRQAGFQKHLTKPINFLELQTAIQEMA